jgi:hypothetical protein
VRPTRYQVFLHGFRWSVHKLGTSLYKNISKVYHSTVPVGSYLRLSPDSRVLTCCSEILDSLQTLTSEFQYPDDPRQREGMYPWFTETESLTSQCKAVLEGESLAEVHYRTPVANQGADSELVEFSLDSYHAFKARISLAAEAARDPQLSIAAGPFFAAFAFVATNRKYCLTDKGQCRSSAG